MNHSIICFAILIVIFNVSCKKSFYKKTAGKGTIPWSNFVSMFEYPQPCKSVIICAGFAKALSTSKTLSPNAMDYINAFKYVDGNCTAGKVTKDSLFDWPNRELAKGPGIHLHQNCYIDQEPKNVSDSVLFLNDLYFYYPSYGDSGDAFYLSDLTPYRMLKIMGMCRCRITEERLLMGENHFAGKSHFSL